MDKIPEELGGDLYLINGNMTKLQDAGIFAASGKEKEASEEGLELEGDKNGGSGNRAGSRRSSVPTHAAAAIGIISIGREAAMEKTNDAYGHENLIRYHTALAFVDHIQAEGFIGAADREEMYALIAQRYGIDKDSIFAA